jgi:hypothetical protein
MQRGHVEGRMVAIQHEEAREALHRYLALPSVGGLKTMAAFKAYYNSQAPKQGGDSSFLEMNGLRKVGMPEGEKKAD